MPNRKSVDLVIGGATHNSVVGGKRVRMSQPHFGLFNLLPFFILSLAMEYHIQYATEADAPGLAQINIKSFHSRGLIYQVRSTSTPMEVGIN